MCLKSYNWRGAKPSFMQRIKEGCREGTGGKRPAQGGGKKGLRENGSAGEGAAGAAHAICTKNRAQAFVRLIQKSNVVTKMNDQLERIMEPA